MLPPLDFSLLPPPEEHQEADEAAEESRAKAEELFEVPKEPEQPAVAALQKLPDRLPHPPKRAGKDTQSVTFVTDDLLHKLAKEKDGTH